ncbi:MULTISPECIES: 1-propanol dehydrogenase PduQ [unclassified Veillonella]|jgi:propanol dehydrogenase|uniref:1-propanol dehydrogenase PduQ n=1 Tax=unclassified Veillonella TaxID=2630086 RepID=UPI00021A312C|nr:MULTISPECIES: 1-propanol dehydrogenase PduQ [unclassified Veillonella]EGS34816.1 alcohol dehydrogenase, iron-dependent [Veillonella sp. oral taxon 780 str. F0422]
MESWSFKTQIFTGQTEHSANGTKTDALERLRLLEGERIFIICDPFLEGTPALQTVIDLVNTSNTYVVYSNVVPDPPIDSIVKGVEVLQKEKATVLIVIGGGSAIDTAKGINYFCKTIYGICVKKFIAIPTTSGTGSEVTSFAVITDTKTGIKYPLADDSLLPDEAILTTFFVKSAPPKVTAYSGMDVLVHAMEALVATEANHFTDALAEKAIELVIKNLPTCVERGTDEVARAAMHEASCMAGLAFNQAGLGITHALAHQLGGQFHVPHGLANAMLLPYVIMYNAANSNEAKLKYISIAQKLSLTTESDDESAQIAALVRCAQSLARRVGCIITMKEFGIDEVSFKDSFPTLVQQAMVDRTYPGNPYAATKEDLTRILTCII